MPSIEKDTPIGSPSDPPLPSPSQLEMPSSAPIEAHTASGPSLIIATEHDPHTRSLVFKRLRKVLPLPSPFMANCMLATLFWVMILAGWNDASQGPLLPSLQDYYNVNYLVISIIWIGNFTGFMTSGISNVFLTDRFGFGIVAPFGSAMQGVAYILMATGGPYPLFVVAYVINGFGLGLQDAQCNSLVSRLDNANTKMFLLHAFYGLGATISPLVSTEFVKRFQSQVYLYFWVSLGMAALTVTSLVLVFRLRTEDQVVGRRKDPLAVGTETVAQSGGTSAEIESDVELKARPTGDVSAHLPTPDSTSAKESKQRGGSSGKMKRIMTTPAVHYMAFYICIYVGVEVTLGGWITEFLLSQRGGNDNAGYVTTGYFAGLTLGRVILIPVTGWIGKHNAIYVYTILAIALEIMVWTIPNLVANGVFFSLIGVVLGPMYPVVMMVVIEVLPGELQAGSIGWIASLGQAGSAMMPFITGGIANKCRSRKAKCGSLPPGACDNCAKRGWECIWPEEDGRTARFRPGYIKRNDSLPSARNSMDGPPGTAETTTAPPRSTGFNEAGPSRSSLGQAETSLMTDWNRSTHMRATSPGIAPPPTTSTSHDHALTRVPSGPTPAPPPPPPPPISAIPPHFQHQPIDLDQFDQQWRDWIVPTPGQSPRKDLPSLGLSLSDTDAFLQSLLQAERSDLHVQVMIDGLAESSRGVEVARKTGVMRIKYRRPHGRTAFVPGTLAIPIKVVLQPNQNIQSPATTSSYSGSSQFDPDLLKNLVSTFASHLGTQYPCIDCHELTLAIDRDPAPSFLLCCVAAMAARFSDDPRLSLFNTKAISNGDVYFDRATSMIGSVMKIPLRETVIGFVLLASCADSVSGQWMLAGDATRMAIDLGLHLNDPDNEDTETVRLNRLCFWSVLLLDYTVSIGVGRSTSIRPKSITQQLPTHADVGQSPLTHVFHMFKAFGPLINMLNSEELKLREPEFMDRLRVERASILRLYQDLPPDMQWTGENLRYHHRMGNGAMFFHLHTWIYVILCSSSMASAEMTGPAQLDKLSISGAKLIVDYLTFCDLIDPAIYYVQPFLGQPLFTAGTVIMAELNRSKEGPLDQDGSTMLEAIAHAQIDTIKRAIIKLSEFWRGARLVETAMEECIRGGTERDKIWVENDSYAVEVYDWSLPNRYRSDGAQVN
ncbi:major facilitator superfamily domain-containing protein [Kockovaella imperatae]|uniref:Major facilitator superfamily domain-containing protein n=1 Tax=Kockovaella imperatae TaxID=4999 RepID=A0A1Y1U8S6_9TREE|nr:major facilitator superfamily domain-containing protein [Kockovaella imperatae]ORX34412.1 major facilitator superfamily domain-containing protein [Kockovaella imperatae]